MGLACQKAEGLWLGSLELQLEASAPRSLCSVEHWSRERKEHPTGVNPNTCLLICSGQCSYTGSTLSREAVQGSWRPQCLAEPVTPRRAERPDID